MKHIVVWGVSVLCALSAVLAGQIGTRMKAAPDPVSVRTVIRVPEEVGSIQQAIRLVSPGGLILVKGYHEGSITIDKPLSLVGDPGATLEMICYPVGIVLAGPGYGSVTLANLGLSSDYECARQRGIAGGGFDELHVFDTGVSVNLYAISGLGYGGPAIDIDVPLATFSNVYAKSAQPDVGPDCIGWLPDEKHAAIHAPNSTVFVADSTLIGGDGGYLCCSNCSCPPTLVGRGGEGGDALVADQAFITNSTLTPGQGSGYVANQGTPGAMLCGTQPDGVPIVANGSATLANDLQGAAVMEIGAAYTLFWALPGPSVWIWFSEGIQAPVPIGVDAWNFLAPGSTVFLGAFATPPNTFGFTLPPAASLLGKRFAFQAASLDGTVSRPVLSMVTD